MFTNKISLWVIFVFSIAILSLLSLNTLGVGALAVNEGQFLGKESLYNQANWSSTELVFLSKFETLESLGFSPDGVAYNPQKAHLFISSASADVPNETGIFEVTLSGELVDHIPFGGTPVGHCCAGYSITRASSGPKVGHYFLADLMGETTLVHEFDSNWNWINAFPVTASNLNAHPGDGIAFNRISQNIVIAEEVYGELLDVTTNGQFVGSFPAVNVQGITYNDSTGTYFGVHTSGWLREISTDGTILREFDLKPFGIMQPVGIASGQGKLFIADEIDFPNSGGYIYIFKSPHSVH